MAIDLQKAADTLVRDHAGKSDLVPFARAWGATDLAGAYAIQEAFVQRMLATHGKRVGYKIGLTSKRMQQMCSIDHPVAGVVLERRLLASGAQLELSSLVRLGIEFEICVRLGRSLPPRAAAYEMDEVAAAVEAVAPDYEVIDDRNSPYPLDMLSLVADNAWNEGIVLGAWRTSWPDLAAARGIVERNGEKIDEGHGRDVLGHPFEPLRWLANHLSGRGETLHAGEIVSTGSLVTTRFPQAGEQYRFTVEGIGAVEVGFRD
jgi:2-keto-4-pentenoate hydratase